MNVAPLRHELLKLHLSGQNRTVLLPTDLLQPQVQPSPASHHYRRLRHFCRLTDDNEKPASPKVHICLPHIKVHDASLAMRRGCVHARMHGLRMQTRWLLPGSKAGAGGWRITEDNRFAVLGPTRVVKLLWSPYATSFYTVL